MNISDKIKHDAAMAAWDYIGKNPEANIPKVLDKVEKLDSNGTLSGPGRQLHADLCRHARQGAGGEQLQRALGNSDGSDLSLQPEMHRLLGGGVWSLPQSHAGGTG